MIERELQASVLVSLAQFPAVGLLGPRQVGKTTLAHSVARLCGKVVFLDLERPSDLAKLADPEIYLEMQSNALVVIDEVQRMPGLFPVLRALIDADRRPGRFLLLGSASPDLLKQSAETLAGRIQYLELAPLTLAEVGPTPENQIKLWMRGGFPGSFLAPSDRASWAWREAFIQTYLERDIPQLGLRLPAMTLRRFWQMLAHHHGQLWNASALAGSLGLSAPSISRYLDVLRGTFVARALSPFAANQKKRLVKSPKVYLRDSGLLHSLLGVRTYDDLLGHPILGASWEGFVIEQLLSRVEAGVQSHFYRTAAGAEIDLVLRGQRVGNVAIEIKHSLAPKPSKGYWQGLSDCAITQGFVVYPGDDCYPLAQGNVPVNVCGLRHIAKITDDG